MTYFKGFNRLLLAALVAAAASLSLLQVAQAGPPSPVVPVDLVVEDGHKVFLVGHAIGVQIYSCNATAGGFAWAFVAPRADLFDDAGNLVIKHFGGPTWQAKDGSRAVGQVLKRVTVDASAIQWLLLSASTAAGGDGDRLVETTFIQRIATTGGLAPPAAECNAARVGDGAEVPYTADYYFWKKIS